MSILARELASFVVLGLPRADLKTLERRLLTGIKSARARRAEGARVRELSAAIREIRHRRRVEGGPVGCVAIVEEIIDAPVPPYLPSSIEG